MSTEHPWMDETKTPRERAEALVDAMTQEQKIAQLHGAMKTINIYALSNDAVNSDDDDAMDQLAAQIQIERHVDGIDELEIPRMRVTNGPVGVGMGDGTPSPPATALPMSIALAAGFDPQLAREYGDIIGSESATLGQHVLEGPGVCLHRTPISGRNFEYYSEDPYLSGVMGVEVTKGIQDNDVIAMGKHYAVNDQETERFRASVEVDEHVLRELYLLPFEMLVKDARIAAIMSAYNRVRGTYATESRYLLHDILRKEWGFEGYVQSDFWSARSAAPSLAAGLDLEMPDSKFFNEENIKAALEDTSIEIEMVDRALVRRFTQMFRFDQFGKEYAPGEIDATAHGAVSRRIGAQSAVLLKNDDARLPLDAASAGKIVIIGQSQFVDEACNGGGGSSKVDPLYTVRPVDGMQDVLRDLGSDATVSKVTVEKDLSNLSSAVDAAKDADTVIIMAGMVATEGADSQHSSLRHRQDELIAAALEADPTAVVVLKDSTAVLMPWINKASAVLEAWNQGAEDGHVVADLLFGNVNPSGKLPTTYMRHEQDSMYHDRAERHPGVDEGDGYPTIYYSEGLEMGYRWFQSQGIRPLFPFGHGLSYTSFELDDVRVSEELTDAEHPLVVSAAVTNTGSVAGAEVVQVYLGIPSAGQPPKRLVGFSKVFLEPGETQRVEIVLNPDATAKPFSVWDYEEGDFVIPVGDYTVYVGTSSEDTPFAQTVTVLD